MQKHTRLPRDAPAGKSFGEAQIQSQKGTLHQSASFMRPEAAKLQSKRASKSKPQMAQPMAVRREDSELSPGNAFKSELTKEPLTAQTLGLKSQEASVGREEPNIAPRMKIALPTKSADEDDATPAETANQLRLSRVFISDLKAEDPDAIESSKKSKEVPHRADALSSDYVLSQYPSEYHYKKQNVELQKTQQIFAHIGQRSVQQSAQYTNLDLEKFAQFVVTQNISGADAGEASAPRFILYDLGSSNHCGHCKHFNFIDIENYKIACHPENCCLRSCNYEARPIQEAQKPAVIDYSKSIDHQQRLEYVYGKYREVIERLKHDFLAFRQREPQRRSVAQAPSGGRKPGSTKAAHEDRIAEMESILESDNEVRRSSTDGLPARLSGRIRDAKKELQHLGPHYLQRKGLTPIRESAAGSPSKGGPSTQRLEDGLPADAHLMKAPSHQTSKGNVILLGIDGKVSTHVLTHKVVPFARAQRASAPTGPAPPSNVDKAVASSPETEGTAAQAAGRTPNGKRGAAEFLRQTDAEFRRSDMKQKSRISGAQSRYLGLSEGQTDGSGGQPRVLPQASSYISQSPNDDRSSLQSIGKLNKLGYDHGNFREIGLSPHAKDEQQLSPCSKAEKHCETMKIPQVMPETSSSSFKMYHHAEGWSLPKELTSSVYPTSVENTLASPMVGNKTDYQSHDLRIGIQQIVEAQGQSDRRSALKDHSTLRLQSQQIETTNDKFRAQAISQQNQLKSASRISPEQDQSKTQVRQSSREGQSFQVSDQQVGPGLAQHVERLLKNNMVPAPNPHVDVDAVFREQPGAPTAQKGVLTKQHESRLHMPFSHFIHPGLPGRTSPENLKTSRGTARATKEVGTDAISILKNQSQTAQIGLPIQEVTEGTPLESTQALKDPAAMGSAANTAHEDQPDLRGKSVDSVLDQILVLPAKPNITDSFKNKSIMTRIDHALTNGMSLVNSLEQSGAGAQLQMMQDLSQKKPEITPKKVKFKIDISGRSSSRSESAKYRISGSHPAVRKQNEQLKLMVQQLSKSKVINEQIMKSKSKRQVALKDLHLRYQRASVETLQGSFGLIDSNKFGLPNRGIGQQPRTIYPISIGNKKELTKEIRIGGKNEALRQMLDQSIRYQPQKKKPAGAQASPANQDLIAVVNERQLIAPVMRKSNFPSGQFVNDQKNDSNHSRFQSPIGHLQLSEMTRYANTMQLNKEDTQNTLKMQNSSIQHALGTETTKEVLNATQSATLENQKSNSLVSAELRSQGHTGAGSPDNVSPREEVERRAVERSKETEHSIRNSLDFGSPEMTVREPKMKDEPPKTRTSMVGVEKVKHAQRNAANHLRSPAQSPSQRNEMNLEATSQPINSSYRSSQVHKGLSSLNSPRGAANAKEQRQNIDVQVSSSPRDSRTAKFANVIQINPISEAPSRLGSPGREATLQELMIIESQLANLLKDPYNISTRRFKSIPKAELITTLRQYVFEENQRSQQVAHLQRSGSYTDSEGERLPAGFIEIKGQKTNIQPQGQVQKLHTNRLHFVKNIENLSYNKKRTRNRRFAEANRFAEDVPGDAYASDETATLDFEQFNAMIKQLEPHGGRESKRPLHALLDQFSDSDHQPASMSQTIPVGMFPAKSLDCQASAAPQMLSQTLDSDFSKIYDLDQSLQEQELLEHSVKKGYLLYQPKTRMKKYSNQRLVNQDGIYLNEEELIKSNIVNENFYRVRETDKIVNHMDLIENKLRDKMQSIKKADRYRREELMRSGRLHSDSMDPSEVLKAQKQQELVMSQEHSISGDGDAEVEIELDVNLRFENERLNQSLSEKKPRYRSKPERQSFVAAKRHHPGGRAQEICTVGFEQLYGPPAQLNHDSCPSVKVLASQSGCTSKQSNRREDDEVRHDTQLSKDEHSRTHTNTGAHTYMQIQETADNDDKGPENHEHRKAPTAFFGSIRGSEAQSEADKAAKKVVINDDVDHEFRAVASQVEQPIERPLAPGILKSPQSLNKVDMVGRDKSRFQSMLTFGNKVTLTRNGVKQAIKDNHLLLDIRKRYESREEEHLQLPLRPQGTQAQTREGSMLLKGAPPAIVNKTVEQTTMPSVPNTNPSFRSSQATANAHNRSAQRVPEVRLPSDRLRQSIDCYRDGSDRRRFFDGVHDIKTAKHSANQSVDLQDRGLRDFIQSQGIAQRPLNRNLEAIQRNFKTFQVNSPIEKVDAFESRRTSRYHQNVHLKNSQGSSAMSPSFTDVTRLERSWKLQNSQSAQKQNPWPKAKRINSRVYLNYLESKKPLLPALINNQITQSKKRSQILKDSTGTIDAHGQMVSLRSKIGHFHGAITSQKEMYRNGPTHSTLIPLARDSADHRRTFDIDSASLFDNELYQQRSKRDSVIPAFKKVSKHQFRAEQLARDPMKYDQSLLMSSKMIPEVFGQESLSNKSDSKQISNLPLRYLSYEQELRTQIDEAQHLPIAPIGPPLNTMSESGEPKSHLQISSDGHPPSQEELLPPSSRNSRLQNRTQEHTLNVAREGQGVEAVQSKSELLKRELLQ